MDSTATSDARQKILNAAVKLFSENGYHATTTRVIAQFAEVNEVTLFRHFKSKQQLFYEILELVKQVGFDTKRLAEAQGLEPEESIRYVIDKFSETLEEHPREFKIMFYAIMDEVEEFESEFIGKHQSKLVGFLEDNFIKLAKLKGKKMPIDTKLHCQMLVSTLLGLSTSRILTRQLPIKSHKRQAICEHVAKLFLNVF